MLRNYLVSALRNLSRNRLYAGVTIGGLAIGFAAALLIGVYVRDELSFDRFVPGHEQVYAVGQTIRLPSARPLQTMTTPMAMAAELTAEFPQIEAVARVTPGFPTPVRRGEIQATERKILWADPDVFRVLPLPVVAGDLATALAPADSVVLTRTTARKYFGRPAPLGAVLEIDRRPYRVTAVIEDLPATSHLSADLLLSTNASASPVVRLRALRADPLSSSVATYIRLRPGVTAAQLEPRLPEFLKTRLPLPPTATPGVQRQLHLAPLTSIHFSPLWDMGGRPSVDPAAIAAVALVGVLIVVVAGINFVTLVTARAARRALEVGVRKAAGASRGQLIVQFMGEALLQVLAAAVLGIAMAELLAPAVGAALQRPMRLDYASDPALGAAILGVVLFTGLLAGAYPAFVLSSFRPSTVLKGGVAQVSGGGLVREALVVGQFAVLIGLVLAATTIARQTIYGLTAGARVDKAQVTLIFTDACGRALRDEVLRVPGVRAAACASGPSLGLGSAHGDVQTAGRSLSMGRVPVGFGYFEAFGIKPLAGRLFMSQRPGDAASSATVGQPVVINETAMRRLGFASPSAAIGKTINWRGLTDLVPDAATLGQPPVRPSEIIGVVPDFTMGSLREPIEPTVFAAITASDASGSALVVKLGRVDPAAALARIDAIGRRHAHGGTPLRVPAALFTLRLYLDTLIQAGFIAAAGVVALTIAALGLFALSAYTTELRTKEIGVRKAMGASTADILKLLVWQFTKPVLWAILIACPVTWVVMRWWLAGFAYRVDLALWTFAAVAAGALLIAWATVSAHALNVARAKPVKALRYE